MSGKGKRFSALVRKGNPLRWYLDIVVPNYGGRKRKDGSPSLRTEYVLKYMNELFKTLNEDLAEVKGAARIYRVPEKKRSKY